uniref:Uncharacterized protein n=1 Tax=Physcomitrium patens TaxID=3218 RepID=A0A2K1JN42_PHYPA|nr:hypothetical protein PHYPA_017791 [Physcomitrium patens]
MKTFYHSACEVANLTSSYLIHLKLVSLDPSIHTLHGCQNPNSEILPAASSRESRYRHKERNIQEVEPRGNKVADGRLFEVCQVFRRKILQKTRRNGYSPVEFTAIPHFQSLAESCDSLHNIIRI